MNPLVSIIRSSTVTLLSLALAATAGCGESQDAGPDVPPDAAPESQAHSYTTTSNVGDLSTWTIDGDNLTVEWQDISTTGEVERTYHGTAVCDPVNPQFGDRSCVVQGDGDCVPGTAACADGDGLSDGDLLRVFEIPGVALLVSTNNSQLHTGFAAGSCEDVPVDDYTFINVGLEQSDIFGLFRTNADLTNAVHMDFGFSDDPENQIAYRTSDPAGIVPSITPSPCNGGVRQLTIDATNDKIRLVVTAAGHLVLDKPEGAGGLLAINAANAADVSDFANKSWGGISFPDDSGPELIELTTGPLTDGAVPVTQIIASEHGDITPDHAVSIHDGSTAPKLNQQLLEPNEPYNTNNIVFGGDYTGGPAELPGIFELDPVQDETTLIGVGATVDGRTILFGAVVNQFQGAENGIKGNFIIFEK